MSNKRVEIYSLIAGLIFIFSGISKSLNAAAFSNIIAGYGFETFSFASPIIILSEIIFGLALIFQILQKSFAAISAITVLFFTLIYLYGTVFLSIYDCGCFGNFTFLSSSPIIVLIRNAILLCLLIIVWIKGENKLSTNRWTYLTILGFVCLTSFITGYTYNSTYNKNLKNRNHKIALRDSKLRDFIETSSDSTYIVFVFSYTCPHCLNSIANLKEYKQAEIADNVIGIALGNDQEKEFFESRFNPNFNIINYHDELLELTDIFPKTYYIQNDTIVMELSGELPNVYLFTNYLKQITQ